MQSVNAFIKTFRELLGATEKKVEWIPEKKGTCPICKKHDQLGHFSDRDPLSVSTCMFCAIGKWIKWSKK